MKKMNKKIKAKWVKALRSGEYKQGQGCLCEKKGSGELYYCCLGVIQQEVSGKRPNPRCRLSAYMLKKIGLSLEAETKLVRMNDASPYSTYFNPRAIYAKSFKQIANWIEKNL